MTGTVLNDGDINGKQGRHGFCLQLSGVRLGEDVNQIITQRYFTNVIIIMTEKKHGKLRP